jgi:hypothetical protein
VGPGYRFNYTATPSRCRPLRLGDAIGRRFAHRGCELFFQRLWTILGVQPGPRYVESVVFAFEGPQGAKAALARPREVASRVFRGLPPDVFEPADAVPAIGDEAAVFRAELILSPFEELTSTTVVWRSGPVLGIVMAFRRPSGHARTDRPAERLAKLQQSRITNPTPLLSHDNDDTEVDLDNPRLGVPVWWLGRHLSRHRSFPAISLHRGDHIIPDRTTPRVILMYGTPRLATNLDISLWRPRTLRRLMSRGRGCQRHYGSGLDGIHSGIVATYEPRRARCPQRPPNAYEGFAFLPGAAVTIDADLCPKCRPGARGSFNSIAGMRTRLRALRPRPAS